MMTMMGEEIDFYSETCTRCRGRELPVSIHLIFGYAIIISFTLILFDFSFVSCFARPELCAGDVRLEGFFHPPHASIDSSRKGHDGGWHVAEARNDFTKELKPASPQLNFDLHPKTIHHRICVPDRANRSGSLVKIKINLKHVSNN